MLTCMSSLALSEFQKLYQKFSSPIAKFDCGKKCAPYNENGIPFCCDTRHVIPTAYEVEWEYLRQNTSLWHLWEGNNPEETCEIEAQLPAGQVLIECMGHTHCQREYRAITCRAFPFFPYLDQSGRFLGLTYYWEFTDRCWIISHLEVVSPKFREEFIETFETIFTLRPSEKEGFSYHSEVMRRIYAKKNRAIPLLHRNGLTYKVSPKNGVMRPVKPETLPKFGSYRIASHLPFPDELT